MNTIEIKKLIISHFKGIKSLEADFGKTTNIRGDNATGKTTIMDAFLWLLFGKDSTDRKEFEVKHISGNGNGSATDVDVEGLLKVNNQSVKLKRVFMEKWVKKRGAPEAEFAGHETRTFYNDVPLNLKEFQDKIAAFCNEDLFKMITSPYYFNSLRWDVQRNILFEMAGDDITDDSVAKGKPEFEALLDELTGKTLDEYKKQIVAQKRKIKSELELIPARIDEVNRSVPGEQDWASLKAELQEGEQKLLAVENAITDHSKAYEAEYSKKKELQERIHEANNKLNSIVVKYKENALKQYQQILDSNRQIKGEMETLRIDISRNENRLNSLNAEIESNEQEREKLRAAWHAENRKEFSFEQSVCPVCNRPFDDIQERKTEMLASFNQEKSSKLRRIAEQGKSLKQLSEEFHLERQKISSANAKIQEKIQTLQDQIKPSVEPEIILDDIPGYTQTKDYVDQMIAQYQEPVEQPEIDKLRKEKREIISFLQDIKGRLALREQILRGNERIRALETQQQTLAQELADHEKIEFIMQRFERAKSDAVEQKINSRFSLVKWRLFEKQINGQEIPTCKAIYKGVPWSDINSAAKANIGLDIINTLSKYYGVTAPIFLDNREGINKLIETPSQLINLSVSKDPQLVIEI